MALSSTLPEILDWLCVRGSLDDTAVDQRARLLLLDTIGCFIAAQGKPEPVALARRFAALDPGPVHLPGTPAALSTSAASFLLAVGACWDEACEGLARAHGQPGLHAIPPVLAIGLANAGDLRAAIEATITGYEIGGRLGAVLRIGPGMHVDGAWRALAAAAARMLGGDARVCATAVEIAACQIPFSLYAPVAAGKTSRNTYCGHGATLGLQSAVAAHAGITAPENAIAQYNSRALGGLDTPIALAPAGESLILEGYLKPFAAVRHVHYGAQAALDWRRERGGDSTRISAISLCIYDEAIRYCGNRAPETAIQAQFSLSHGLARTLLTGDLGPEAYTATALGNLEVHRLEKLVDLVPDPDLSQAERRGATLTITTAETSTTHAVASVPGDPGNPLSHAAVTAKFTRYASPVVGERTANRLIDKVLDAPLETALGDVLADAYTNGAKF